MRGRGEKWRVLYDGPYSPENCRLVDRAENMRNSSVIILHDYKGKKYSLAEIVRLYAVDTSIHYDLVWERVKVRG
jgi:hypothetical protein